ncbi:arylesterase [Marinimicrobium sp. C2-29]|uniref:arylesterase n=1 Tax=Marinimicrobium sp. C2-29 TaxID=3139825 RepID=UPI0031396E9F
MPYRFFQRLIHCSLLLCLLVLAPLSAADEPPSLLVLGDSLSAAYGIDESEGWVQLMAEKLEAEGYPHRVINASVSGETSEGGLNRLPKLLKRHQPEWVLLELGGNDGLRGYPLSQLEENLTRAIERIRASGARVILLGMQIPPNYGSRYAGQFADLFPTLAEDLDLPFVTFMLEGIATNDQYMQGDGIHPNAKAQPLILDNVWPGLQAELKAAE